MILFNPPSVRNCEPPVGLSRLAGALLEAGEPVTLIDGAREAPEYLAAAVQSSSDAQIRRVVKSRDRILHLLTTEEGYRSFDRYRKALSDYLRLLNAPLPPEIQLTPADCRYEGISPLRSSDIRRVMDHPEEHFLFPWLSRRLDGLLSGKEDKLGISLNFQSQVLTTAAVIGYLQREHQDVRLIMGGGLVSSWGRTPGLDALPFTGIRLSPGRGEEEIVRFCEREYKGPGLPFFGDLFDHSYIAPLPILPYAAANGCSWKRCTFCAERWEDYPYSELAAEISLDQLRRLADRHNPGFIHLTDSEISPVLLDGIMETPPGIPWYGFSRFLKEMVKPDYCRRLAASGCRMLCLGLESGDQNVLNSMKKGIRTEMVSAILNNLKDAGIGTFVYLLFGTPAEERDAALRTRDFVMDHRKCIDYMNLAVFTMPRISGETADLETSDFYEGDLSLSIDFSHPSGWNRREVRRFLDREFRGVPELREILKRTPPVYTSSHGPFFLSHSH